MNLRTLTFWMIYNTATKRVIATDKTKKALRERWDVSDSPWCVLVKMKGHYVKPRGDHGAR